MRSNQTIYIIDDDPGVRNSLSVLLMTEKFKVESYDSADTFLMSLNPNFSGCIILDIRMPKMTGLELQDYLSKMNIDIPVIFITAHADVKTAVRAMKNGSFDFIEKPYEAPILLDVVYRALSKNSENRAYEALRNSANEKINSLTEREKEVLIMVIQGKPSKIIADCLDLTTSTVDNHRAKIMKKLEVETSTDLVRIALTASPRLLRHPSYSRDDSE